MRFRLGSRKRVETPVRKMFYTTKAKIHSKIYYEAIDGMRMGMLRDSPHLIESNGNVHVIDDVLREEDTISFTSTHAFLANDQVTLRKLHPYNKVAEAQISIISSSLSQDFRDTTGVVRFFGDAPKTASLEKNTKPYRSEPDMVVGKIVGPKETWYREGGLNSDGHVDNWSAYNNCFLVIPEGWLEVSPNLRLTNIVDLSSDTLEADICFDTADVGNPEVLLRPGFTYRYHWKGRRNYSLITVIHVAGSS